MKSLYRNQSLLLLRLLSVVEHLLLRLMNPRKHLLLNLLCRPLLHPVKNPAHPSAL
jgi:hypothetical protein